MKRLLLTLFLTFLIGISFFAGKVYAEAKPIPGFKIPCDDPGRNPEFHSDRPYQASPCGDSIKATFCGNVINIIETKGKTAKGWVDSTSINWSVDKPYWIDLAGTTLPILGNTELVRNSQTSNEQIDDATKMNEYVSWYLNGVNNRAEYGTSKSTSYETVNLSGPLQKLLPSIIQEAQRTQIIKSASLYVPTPDEDKVLESSGEAPPQQSKPENHNQIVVCASHQILGVLGKMVPHECYAGNGGPATEKVYRLKDWNSHLPPLPWDPKFENNSEAYTKARCEWQGGSYITVPFINKSFCIDNPLNSNEWADLFPYVPLANTSDRNAKMPIFTVTIQPGNNTEMESSEYKILEEPTHFYPHTLEDKQLTDLLKSTYEAGKTSGQAASKTTSASSSDVENNSNCRIVNVRSNPGDNLFPVKQPADIGVHITFKVSSIPCQQHTYDKEGLPVSKCEGRVNIGIHTDPVKVPYANQIWDNTVAGSSSIFRRIYPKVEAGAPVSCIADIPTVTNAVYTPVEGTNKIGVTGPIGSPDETKMDPENAQIYFPHIGSVYDYFLKGIQTALRPQGYGEPRSASGKECQKSSENFGDICAVADAYHIPCCQLKGVAEIETGGGKNVGGSSCQTKNGNFKCCNGNVCGPSQVACGQYDGFAGKDKIDMCDPVGSAELLARAMLLKLCQAAGKCDTYDWEKEKSKAMQFKVKDGDYTATAYFYGLNNGCTVNACTEYRWGAGKTYCDSVKSYCQSGKILPDNPHPEFCSACNQDLERAGQQPINCSQ